MTKKLFIISSEDFLQSTNVSTYIHTHVCLKCANSS